MAMPTSRSYGDACGIARALDVVGERWALLIVRELLLGPQRFSDLRHALPKASSNLIADRLRELDAHGVIRRRRLPPPAASWVYELTEWGRDLEPILLALGGWGLRVPQPAPPVTLSATSVLLFLRGSVRPSGPPATYRLELEDRTWTVRADAGKVHITPGEPPSADASLRTDPVTLNALLSDPTARERYESNYTKLLEGLRESLAGCRSVYTHNPWGEYGHAEHIQVHNAVTALQSEIGYTVWFSNYVGAASWTLARGLAARLSWARRALVRPDVATARALMRVYRRYGAWTWTSVHRWPAQEVMYAQPPMSSPDLRHPLSGEWLLDAGRLRWWPLPWRSARRHLPSSPSSTA